MQMQEFRFVQASIRRLQSVYVAVVTQLKRQNLSITKRVTTVASSYDPRMTFSIDPSKCSSRIKSVTFALEVRNTTTDHREPIENTTQ